MLCRLSYRPVSSSLLGRARRSGRCRADESDRSDSGESERSLT
jgi:hypothetical protein